MKTNKRTKSAYTLLELLVASAIFAGMIIAATAALSAAASLHGKEQATYEVTNYTQSLMRQITTQVSRANAVTVGPDFLIISSNPTDHYGRLRSSLSSSEGICAENGVLHTRENPIPLDAGGIGCSPTGPNGNKYTVSLTTTPYGSNAIRIQLMVKGSLGTDEVRSSTSGNQVSYSDVAIVEYHAGSTFPYSIESVQ